MHTCYQILGEFELHSCGGLYLECHTYNYNYNYYKNNSKNTHLLVCPWIGVELLTTC